MVKRDIRTFLESKAIDTVGSIEDTIDQHTIHIKIGLYLIVGNIQQLFLHLGRIVETVVGLQLEISTFCLTGEVFNGLCLCISLR